MDFNKLTVKSQEAIAAAQADALRRAAGCPLRRRRAPLGQPHDSPVVAEVLVA